MLEVIINKSCKGQWIPNFVNVEFDISFTIKLKEICWEFAIPPLDVHGWLFYLTKTVKKITLNWAFKKSSKRIQYFENMSFVSSHCWLE